MKHAVLQNRMGKKLKLFRSVFLNWGPKVFSVPLGPYSPEGEGFRWKSQSESPLLETRVLIGRAGVAWEGNEIRKEPSNSKTVGPDQPRFHPCHPVWSPKCAEWFLTVESITLEYHYVWSNKNNDYNNNNNNTGATDGKNENFDLEHRPSINLDILKYL